MGGKVGIKDYCRIEKADYRLCRLAHKHNKIKQNIQLSPERR